MSLRHDDDLPPLTPEQRSEALRLAARLQAEATSQQEFFRAAEEAGIEPRFLHEAVAHVAQGPALQTVVQDGPAIRIVPVGGMAALLAVAALLTAGPLPPFAACFALAFLFAVLPTSHRRPRRRVYATVVLAMLAFDAALALAGMDLPHGDFTVFGLSEILGVVFGCEFARLACRLPARAVRQAQP